MSVLLVFALVAVAAYVIGVASGEKYSEGCNGHHSSWKSTCERKLVPYEERTAPWFTHKIMRKRVCKCEDCGHISNERWKREGMVDLNNEKIKLR